MSKIRATKPIAEPLEMYAQAFDDLFSRVSQRQGFRDYLIGLLLADERNKTLTGLMNTEPVVGAQEARAQRLQWFLSESNWDASAINERRVKLLMETAELAPRDNGVLVIDETGDRKAGHKTAHVGRQYMANLGKIDNGVVSVTSLWADEGIYYPLAVEPYTPAAWFEGGKKHPQFRTKLKIAVELVSQAKQRPIPFRAVVADSFYGEDRGFRSGLEKLKVGYVLALKQSYSWWHPADQLGSLQEIALATAWSATAADMDWLAVKRTFRDGHTELWWALEVTTGPFGPKHELRAIVVSTDPAHLPPLTTWYLITNLPAPGSSDARADWLFSADIAEVVRLYSLRSWVEQNYKQMKHALGWAEYQVRSDLAIRRHWALVFCAFSFCWWHLDNYDLPLPPLLSDNSAQPVSDPATPLNNELVSHRILCWPLALRRVRAWLQPFILLQRFWQAFSVDPLPLLLRHFVDSLARGNGIDLYSSA